MTSRNLGTCLLVLAFMSSVIAQEKSEKPAGTSNSEVLRRLLDKVDQLDRDLKTVLKNAPKGLPENPADRKLVALLETPVIQSFHLGVRNNQPVEQRVFAAKLTLVNLTPDAKSIEAAQVTLDADGNLLKNGVLDAMVQNFSLTIGQQGYQLSNLKPTPTLKIASGQTASTWVLFGGLPRGPGLPKLKLSIADGDKPTEIDINAWASAKLDFSSQRLGPRGCLALLTIGGELNFISYGALVEELERLASQKVTRVVVRWSEGAPGIDLNLSYQFIGMAQNLGRTDQLNQQLPSLPQSFTEFRLAELPAANQGQSNYGMNMYGPVPNPVAVANASVVHKTTADAVMAALRTAYEVVPRNELLDDIRSSDSLTRAAALAAGGGRLASEHLPLILQLADDNDPALQKAALVALRHFGEPEAIEKLLGYARKNTEPLASMAVESLAGSRYSAAHDALLGLLDREGAESRKTIVKVLAQYPRPIWSETIYKYVRDPQGGLGIDGLQALVRVGHPKLVEVLKETLDSRDAAMREAAFNELVNQSDAASEQIALQYTLKQMETAPPTASMLAFLNKTKDQASVPLLLKHLKNPASDRTALINTLAQIGDQTVADLLVEQYGTLRPNEQVAVLGILGQLKSPAFLKLAAGAMESADASIVSTVCQWLQNDASPAAVKLLIQTLEKTTQPNTIVYTANALGQVATADARAALRKARSSNDPNKQAQGRQALTILYQRSPAMQYVYQARAFEQQKDHKSAMELYDQAIKTDPELPDAFSGRANVFIRMDKYPEAKKDFEKAVALDDLNHIAATGLGICLAVEGKFEEGIKVGEELRSKYASDGLYRYNIACIYGRAVEKLLKDDKLPDREKKLESYRRKALDDLRESQKLGYNDPEWTKKDPDLASLHDLPEFQELSGLKP
jgi:HEAT repeat protein